MTAGLVDGKLAAAAHRVQLHNIHPGDASRSPSRVTLGVTRRRRRAGGI